MWLFLCLLLLASARLLASDFITAEEYALFLQQNAANDPQSFFDEKMSDSLGSACIQRSGVPGSYCYKTEGCRLKAEGAEQSSTSPIAFLSWKDARYYCAWKNSHQPSSISYVPCRYDSGVASVDPELRSTQIYFVTSAVASLSMTPPPGTAAEAASSTIEEILLEMCAVVAAEVFSDRNNLLESRAGHSSMNEERNEVNNGAVSFLANGTLTQSHIVMDSIHSSSPYAFDSLSDDEIERLKQDCYDKDESLFKEHLKKFSTSPTLFNGHEMQVVNNPTSSSSSANQEAFPLTGAANGAVATSSSMSRKRRYGFVDNYSSSGNSLPLASQNKKTGSQFLKNAKTSQAQSIVESEAKTQGDLKSTTEYISPEDKKLLERFKELTNASMSAKEARFAVIEEGILAKVKEEKKTNKTLNPRKNPYRGSLTKWAWHAMGLLGSDMNTMQRQKNSIITKILDEHFPLSEKEISPENKKLLERFNELKTSNAMNDEEARFAVIEEGILAKIKEYQKTDGEFDPRTDSCRDKLKSLACRVLKLLGVDGSDAMKQNNSIVTKVLGEHFPLPEKESTDETRKLDELLVEKITSGKGTISNDNAIQAITKEEGTRFALELIEEKKNNENDEANLRESCRKPIEQRVYNILKHFGLTTDDAMAQRGPITKGILNECWPLPKREASDEAKMLCELRDEKIKKGMNEGDAIRAVAIEEGMKFALLLRDEEGEKNGKSNLRTLCRDKMMKQTYALLRNLGLKSKGLYLAQSSIVKEIQEMVFPPSK